MSEYFKPYEGKRPYLFISYSHRNSETVLETISILHAHKVRLWYDEGIPAGSDWSRNIEEHMQACATVLFFVSGPALASPNCRSEIKAALALKKQVVCIPLEPTEPDGDWAEMLQESAALLPEPTAAARAESIQKSAYVPGSFYQKPLEALRWDRVALAAALLVFVAAAVGLYALMSGRLDRYLIAEAPSPRTTAAPSPRPTATPSPTPTATAAPTPTPDFSDTEALFPVRFPDEVQELGVRSALGKLQGDILYRDLVGITSLHFCGQLVAGDRSDIAYADGAYSVFGLEAQDGAIADLSVLGRISLLRELTLIRQPVTDLTPLGGLVTLETLDLSGCDGVLLSTLPALPRLKTLHLNHSKAEDLTPLLAQPQLSTVTVTADMLPLILPEQAAFEVYLVR